MLCNFRLIIYRNELNKYFIFSVISKFRLKINFRILLGQTITRILHILLHFLRFSSFMCLAHPIVSLQLSTGNLLEFGKYFLLGRITKVLWPKIKWRETRLYHNRRLEGMDTASASVLEITAKGKSVYLPLNGIGHSLSSKLLSKLTNNCSSASDTRVLSRSNENVPVVF